MNLTTDRPVSDPADNARPAALPPDYVDHGSALSRLPRLPFELLMVLLIVMIFMGVGLVLMRSSMTDATEARDAASAERDAVAAQLEIANVELAAANTLAAELQSQLDGATDSTDVTSTVDADRVTDLEAELAASEATVAQLTDDATKLQAEVDALDAQLAAAATAPAATVDVAAPVSTSPTFGDPTARYIGEMLADADGLRITAAEATCLGRGVIGQIGLDQVATGMSSARTAATNDVVIQAIIGAAATCGIDPGRIFAQ